MHFSTSKLALAAGFLSQIASAQPILDCRDDITPPFPANTTTPPAGNSTINPPSNSSTSLPTKYGVVLFPAFQALDVFGPLDVLNFFSTLDPVAANLSLSVLAHNMSPVSTKPYTKPSQFGELIVPTHTFADAPEDLEVLIVPGGGGTRAMDVTTGAEEPVLAAIDFIRETYPKLKYLITICTGSALAAQAGVLDGKKATTNKKAWDWVTSKSSKVDWVPKARWVVDGNVWSSSGVAAGIDATYAYVASLYGEEKAEWLANMTEYNRVTDPSNDPFADYWNVTGKA